ncbi:hypothetical protein [Bordetella genomosp. 11]|uniref:Uncharacterized protein n=1 Tax=Bordetella genomosp. 11 TaxID=1416808 RepID=A0A261UJV2_9BORD|nr:hypothetical protein [Bordetella genomosp. 11]OZI61901.1 hypothetical protein CAL28_21920 [Bordetella genomosp. 11]
MADWNDKPWHDRRKMFSVFDQHAASSAVLMFNSGPAAGEAVGEYRRDPLYHASLSTEEYKALLHGIVVRHYAWVKGDASTIRLFVDDRSLS